MKININTQLNDIYRDLLQEYRQLTVKEQTHQATCLHCNRTRPSHLSDGRCSVSFGNNTFVNIEKDKIDRCLRQLELIEELMQL
jgi:hypothetical protein